MKFLLLQTTLLIQLIHASGNSKLIQLDDMLCILTFLIRVTDAQSVLLNHWNKIEFTSHIQSNFPSKAKMKKVLTEINHVQ